MTSGWTWQTGAESTESPPENGRTMKKLGIAGIITSGLAAAVVGLAAPAAADYSHHDWVYDIQPHATVPHVDTSVHQSH